MKRYFNNIKEKQVVMIEFPFNSVIKNQSISDLFGSNKDTVEVNKGEYLRLKGVYEEQNETNLTMVISR